MNPACPICKGVGWVCENHPDKPWDAELGCVCGAGAGALCKCNETDGIGGQAEYLRVPMADVGPIKVPNNVTDEQALFLSDIFPTGYMISQTGVQRPGDAGDLAPAKR